VKIERGAEHKAWTQN